MHEIYQVQLNVTRDCNLRCTHCYIHSDTKSASGQMGAEEFLDVIRQVVALMVKRPTYRLVDIHVIGGEPTMLGLDYFETVLPQARALLSTLPCASTLRLVTNLLTPESAAIARLFDHVSTSYEVETRFGKPLHEKRWQANVLALEAEGRTLQVTTTMTRPVVEQGAPRVLEYLTGLGLRQIHFGFFVPSGDALVHASEVIPSHQACAEFLIEAADWYLARRGDGSGLLLSPVESMLAAVEHDEAIDDIICPIISGCVDINWNGDTAICIQLGGNQGTPVAGNVFTIPLVDVVNSLPARQEMLRASRPRDICNQCDEYHLCRGACGVMHDHWDGRGECPGYKSFIKHIRNLVQKGVRSLQGPHGQVEAAERYMVTRQ